MTLFSQLLGIASLFCILSLILFVIFGQITVRKLRKNNEVKNVLGIEFASGWDILNVAGALTLPKKLNRKLKQSSMSVFFADAEILYAHTNLLDRCLARIFFIAFYTSFSSLIILVIMEYAGIFG